MATKVASVDPNNIQGPSGFGPSSFVKPELFSYGIEFENEPSATAPAQVVTVKEQLDPNLDWTTFQLGSIGFGNTVINVPSGQTSFSTRVDLSATLGIYVDVSANFDSTAGTATWTFTSLDPATLDVPTNPLAGFLPPDDALGDGMGFVNYTIRPLGTLTTGATISGQASVVFDMNGALTTVQIVNTIDAVAPTSSVSPLPATTNAANFTVSWSGQDDPGGSGVGLYNIYVSDNGGSFTLWQSQTTAASATYTGQDGHTYGFTSQAIDNAGNVESLHAMADTQTTVVLSTVAATIAGPLDGFSGIPGQARTYTLTATDSSSANQAAGFTFTINWGDGQTDNIGPGAASPATAEHVYTAPGAYTITLTVLDQQGSTSPAVTTTANIVPFEAQGTTLAVGGTTGNDAIVFSATKTPGQLSVKLNGSLLGTFQPGSVQVYDDGGSDTITVNGSKSNDSFVIDPSDVVLSGLSIAADNAFAWRVNAHGGNDTFTVNPGAHAHLNGGTGVSTLVGPDTNNVWQISGTNRGNINHAVFFTSFENLIGGTLNDRFRFTPGANLSGTLDGGTGTNKLDYSAYSADVTVNLESHVATGIASFANIQVLAGAGLNDTLIGPDTNNVWQISGTNRGNINHAVFFTNFENLVGGAQNDRFRFTTGVGGVSPQITGTLDGGQGTNTLDCSSLTTDVTVNLATGSATGVGGGVTNIQNVMGGQGNDNLTGDAANNVLIGGNGNNTLTAGSGNDILIGGSGTNVLFGGAGRDILIGGSGSDQLTAGSGDAILIGGSTKFDKNLAALEAILAEWARTDETYDQRVSHIHGFTSGGLNGGFFLRASTVNFGASPDTLNGGAGMDWFWANLAIDTITGQRSGERVN